LKPSILFAALSTFVAPKQLHNDADTMTTLSIRAGALAVAAVLFLAAPSSAHAAEAAGRIHAASTSSSSSTSDVSSPSTSAPTPPFWGPTWTAPFNQTITLVVFQYKNVVDFRYDATVHTNGVKGVSRYDHSEGQIDEICTQVKGKENSSEPCSLIAAADTWRYVLFPQSSVCCRVCNTSDYCGIVAPDWLQVNATYQGQQTIAGMQCDGWMKQGGEQNYFYAEVGTSNPCMYYEGYPTLPFTKNEWDFIPSAFNRAPIDPSVFVPPPGIGCENMCQMTDTTYEQRLAWRYEAGTHAGRITKLK
jgi:hypothetical protein